MVDRHSSGASSYERRRRTAKFGRCNRGRRICRTPTDDRTRIRRVLCDSLRRGWSKCVRPLPAGPRRTSGTEKQRVASDRSTAGDVWRRRSRLDDFSAKCRRRGTCSASRSGERSDCADRAPRNYRARISAGWRCPLSVGGTGSASSGSVGPERRFCNTYTRLARPSNSTARLAGRSDFFRFSSKSIRLASREPANLRCSRRTGTCWRGARSRPPPCTRTGSKSGNESRTTAPEFELANGLLWTCWIGRRSATSF